MIIYILWSLGRGVCKIKHKTMCWIWGKIKKALPCGQFLCVGGVCLIFLASLHFVKKGVIALVVLYFVVLIFVMLWVLLVEVGSVSMSGSAGIQPVVG